MSCKCIKCGMVTTCGEKYCEYCMIDECMKTDTSKNIASGGRFYGEELGKGDNEQSSC